MVLFSITILFFLQWKDFNNPKAALSHPVKASTIIPNQKDNSAINDIKTENAPSPSTSEKVVETPEEQPEIIITFAGDTMFDWGLRPILEQHGYDYPFTYIKDKVQNADYSFINVESVFTERTAKDPHQRFWIKSDVRGIEAMKNAGFKMLNLGNNHTLDYLQAGLLDTIENVEKNEIGYIGAGRNEEEAYESKEIMIKGKKFRFFTFVRFIPATNWIATKERAGVPNGYDLELVKKTIQDQQGDADYTIVYFHWGVEKQNTPVEYQKEYVRELKKLGVDLIVGSHSHWLQGFEYYEGMPVAYSLGNFLFPPYVKDETAQTGLLSVSFKGDKVTMAFDPHIIVNGQIRPLSVEDRSKMFNYLQSISYDVSITENGDILRK